MGWTYLSLIGIVLLGGIAAAFFHWRREQRLTLTPQALRCPAYDCPATLTVRTDPIAHPRDRYVDVTACSVLPVTSFVPLARTAYFPDGEAYIYAARQAPRHSTGVACPKRCLLVLNAAESCFPGTPIRTPGTSDSLELARRTQSPSMMRQLWFHGV